VFEFFFALFNSQSKFDFLVGRRFFRNPVARGNPSPTSPSRGRHGVPRTGLRLRHTRFRRRWQDPTSPGLPLSRSLALRAPCSGSSPYHRNGVGVARARVVLPAHIRRRFAPPALLVPQAAAPARCSPAAAGADRGDDTAAGGVPGTSAPTAGCRASFRSDTTGTFKRAAFTTSSTVRYLPLFSARLLLLGCSAGGSELVGLQHGDWN
jgi:hypothetical protein